MSNNITLYNPGDLSANQNPVLLSALATAKALLQRRLCAADPNEHARAVRSLDAFVGNLQTADPALAHDDTDQNPS